MIKPLKIVFTGPVGSGKTSAVETISEVPVVQTEVVPTDNLRQNKSNNNGYGLWRTTVDDEQTLAIYGTPGQTRFAYMWDILSKDALGIIILVSNRRESQSMIYVFISTILNIKLKRQLQHLE